MFKENGKLDINSQCFKETEGVLSPQGEPLIPSWQSTRINLDSSLPTATEIIPQSTKNSRDIFKEIMQEVTNAYAKSRENSLKNSKISPQKDLER